MIDLLNLTGYVNHIMWYVHLKSILYCYLENMHKARKSFFDVEIVKCLELNEICCDFKLWNTFLTLQIGLIVQIDVYRNIHVNLLSKD